MFKLAAGLPWPLLGSIGPNPLEFVVALEESLVLAASEPEELAALNQKKSKGGSGMSI
jgi:hypothetical protein